MNNLITYEDFLFESELNEADVNYQTDQFALVLVGGSIGSKGSFPLFVSGQMASIFQTGNDKEELVEKKKRMNKQLSPGEKKYYGMSYKVIELTASKRKDVEFYIAQQSKSENDTAVVSESINENELNENAKKYGFDAFMNLNNLSIMQEIKKDKEASKELEVIMDSYNAWRKKYL